MLVVVVVVAIDAAGDPRIRCFLALLDLLMLVDARSWKETRRWSWRQQGRRYEIDDRDGAAEAV